MATKTAINGFGRIGRGLLRAALKGAFRNEWGFSNRRVDTTKFLAFKGF